MSIFLPILQQWVCIQLAVLNPIRLQQISLITSVENRNDFILSRLYSARSYLRHDFSFALR